MNHVMRRTALAFGALALVGGALFSGCGGSESSPPPDEIVFRWPGREFDITVWPEGKAAGEPERYTLTCTEPSGDHPDPERACEAANDLTAKDFKPVPPDAICTEIYGGPQEARIEGRLIGAGDQPIPVALDLSRDNGCQIDLWDRFAEIVPQPASLG
jgi:hypothetical protein